MKIIKLIYILITLLSVLVITACDSVNDGDETDESGGTTEYIYVPEETTSDGTIKPENAAAGQCFLNSFAKVGIPLVCHGYPDGVTYNWKIEYKSNDDVKKFSEETGIFTPGETELESMITVSVDGYDDISIYCSELPVLYINGEAEYSKIGRGDYTDAYVKTQGNSYINMGLYEGGAGIRLRGNTTANLDKRPFKLKLDKKEDLLGIEDGYNRHYVLLANGIDHTCLRNKLLYDLSADIGTECYISSENVVLIYNGEYEGVYQLCEQVRVGSSRVDVYDWESAASDAADAVAHNLLTEGSILKENTEKTADDIEEILLKNLSWIDDGKFTYNKRQYSFDSLGIKLPATTGGYLMEMDFFSYNATDLARIESAYKQPLYFNSPAPSARGVRTFTKTSLYQNAYNYMQSFEYALHSSDFFYRESDTHYTATAIMRVRGMKCDATDKYGYAYIKSDYSAPDHDGMHYTEFFDMDSLVNNFIFCELAMNWDSMKNSFFYYKDTDGLAKIGPQWDFDWAWGNINMFNFDTDYPTSWHTTEDDFTVEYYYQKVQWNRMLIRDPYFLMLAYEKYHELRNTVIEDLIRDGGVLQTSINNLRTAALANDYRWSYSYKAYKGERYDDACESMTDFINTRISWLDRQFKSIDTLTLSLGYYASHKDISITAVTPQQDTTKIDVAVYDDDIKTVTFQINGTQLIDADVIDGYASVTLNNIDLRDSGLYNCVEAKAKNAKGAYIINKVSSNPGIYNNTVSDFEIFICESDVRAEQSDTAE